jgi:hypothetical protein
MNTACSTHGEVRDAYKIFVRKPEGKRPLGRPIRRWEEIELDVTEIECEGVDWIRLFEDRDHWRARVNTVLIFGLHKT